MKCLKRNQYKWNDQGGFTIMELIIASAISIMVLGMVAQVFTQQRAAFSNQTNMAKMVANGRGAVEFVTRAIQNAGYHVIRGGKILSGGDHYVTTVSDLDDDGVVEGEEILTYVVSSVNGTNNRSISFDAYFDMNGDGQLHSSETATYTVNYSLSGPPFNLLQFTPKADGTLDSYVVAENIDNLVFRFYDHSGNEMGVNATDGSAPTKTNGLNNLPIRVENNKLPIVRTVNMEYTVRTKDADENAHFINTGSYIDGSVATQLTGTPQASTGGYTDSYRRRVMTAQASPRNLGLAPFGRLTIQPSQNPITCPETSTPFTVTAVDSAGAAIDNWNVNLRVTDPTNVSVSANSVTTDSQGEATGAISYNWVTPSFTTTLSADAQWTDLDGTLRSVITSVPISFVSPTGAGVFDDFNDGDSIGWAADNPSQWEVDNNEYKLVDGPSGTVNAINPMHQGDATADDKETIANYTVSAGAGGHLKLVVGVGAEATLSGGTPTVLNPQEFANGGGASNAFTTPTYTIPNAANPQNTLKLVVVVSTEDNSSGDLTAASASFGGVAMEKILGKQTDTSYEAATTMFYLDVTAGQSGPIAIGWPQASQSHQVVNVITLENVQPGGPEVAGVGFKNTSGNVSNATVATLNDDTMLVLGATAGDTDSFTATGAGHTIHSNNDTTDGGTMRGTLGTALVPTAGTVTNLGMSGSANRMSLVIAGFAPSSAASTTPTYVRFNGTDMNQVATAQFAGGTGVTGSTLYELDVNAGDSGSIDVQWAQETSERFVTVATLTDVASGPILAAQTGTAADENNNATDININAVTQGSIAVSFGFENHTNKVQEKGPGHSLLIDEQTVSGSSATWGGMGTVDVLADGNLNGFGYQGPHTRRAAVMANFKPALVTVNDEISSTGCQPWSDVEVLVKMKNRGNVSSPRFAGAIVRYEDANNYYFVRIQHDTVTTPVKEENYTLTLIKRDGGVETPVGASETITFETSTLATPVDYYLKVRVVGDDFKVRWWKPADPTNPTADEPSTWNLERTDAGSSVTAGTIGLMSNRQEFLFDNVSAGPPV